MNLDQTETYYIFQKQQSSKIKTTKKAQKKQLLNYFLSYLKISIRHIKKKLMGKSLNLENTAVKLFFLQGFNFCFETP